MKCYSCVYFDEDHDSNMCCSPDNQTPWYDPDMKTWWDTNTIITEKIRECQYFETTTGGVT